MTSRPNVIGGSLAAKGATTSPLNAARANSAIEAGGRHGMSKFLPVSEIPVNSRAWAAATSSIDKSSRFFNANEGYLAGLWPIQ